MTIPFWAFHYRNLLNNYGSAAYNVGLRATTLRAQIAAGGSVSAQVVVEDLQDGIDQIRSAYTAMPKTPEAIAAIKAILVEWGYNPVDDPAADAGALDDAYAAIKSGINAQAASLLPVSLDPSGSPVYPNLTQGQKTALTDLLDDMLALIPLTPA